jgi:hypothetical protein
MKIIINSANAHIRGEASKWSRGSDRLNLRRLVQWASKKEGHWGECFLFIECNVPKPEDNWLNQIDLMLVFDERMVFSEMKRHLILRDMDIEEVPPQIQRQSRTLNFLFKRFFGQPQRLAFFPNLKESELIIAKTKLSSAHARQDILVCGAHPDLPLESQWRIENTLDRLLSAPSFTDLKGRKLQDYLLKRVRSTAPVSEFQTCDLALDALKLLSCNPELSLPDDYVHGLRQKETSFALKLISRTGVVVLTGGRGTGKSRLSLDLIGQTKLPYRKLFIEKTPSLSHLLERVEQLVEGYVDETLSDDQRFHWIINQPKTFWIYGFDSESKDAVVQFVALLRHHRIPDGAIAILESREPIELLTESSILLEPMSGSDIYKLLQAIPSGGYTQSIEQVKDEAKGHPQLAVNIWKSTPGNRATIKSDLSWFKIKLTLLEQDTLRKTAFALERAPFGLPYHLLLRYIRVSTPTQLITTLSLALNNVIEALVQGQLLNRISFSREKFGGLLDQLLPDNIEIDIVSGLDRSLFADLNVEINSIQRQLWQSAFQNILQEDAQENNLSEVTFWLNEGELEPFFRSNFRFTSLNAVISEWIDRTPWPAEGLWGQDSQNYLLLALRVLAAISNRQAIDLDGDLGKPNPHSKQEVFAYEFVKARQQKVLGVPETFSGQAWLESEVDNLDLDLLAARVDGLAISLVNSMRHNEAYSLLNQSLQRFQPGTHAWNFVAVRILAILNTKQGKKLEGQAQALQKTESLSKEVIISAAKSGNVHLVSEALFFYVRGHEFQDAREDFQAVLGYLSAIQWMESIPFAIDRWQLKRLLTRGSVHRHALRPSNITWDDYCIHTELALQDYERSFHLAVATNHVYHMLNASSYSTFLVCKGLQYSKEMASPVLFKEFCCRALNMTLALISKSPDRSELEENMWHNTHSCACILRSVEAVLDNESEAWSDLAFQWRCYLREVLFVQGEQRAARYNRFEAARDIRLLIVFSRIHGVPQFPRLMKMIEPFVTELIIKTERYDKDKKFLKVRQQLIDCMG